ncbi:MAG: GDSL-type esterase/lipase family protein [Anaeromyxobacter sp.]
MGLTSRCTALLAGALAWAASACTPSRSGAPVPGTVAAVGDSITQGVARELPNIHTPYPDTLQRRLGPGWRVRNFGVGGYRVAEVAARWERRVRGRGYATVVVLAGINDLQLGAAAEEVSSQLERLHQAIRADGSTVVAVTVTPYRGWALNPWTEERQRAIDAVNARLRSSCTQPGCRLVEAGATLEDPARPGALLPAFDQGDHLHLSQAGLDRLAELVEAALRQPP